MMLCPVPQIEIVIKKHKQVVQAPIRGHLKIKAPCSKSGNGFEDYAHFQQQDVLRRLPALRPTNLQTRRWVPVFQPTLRNT